MQEGKTRYIAVVCAVIFLYANTSLAAVPTIVLEYYEQVAQGEEISIDASKSFASDTDDLHFAWFLEHSLLSTSSVLHHAFASAGEYALALEVADGVATSSVSIHIDVLGEDIVDEIDDDGDMISVVSSPETITISELLPNPIGSDDAEWIELYNYGSEAVDVAGWKLADASGRVYSISSADISDIILAPGVFLLLPRSITGIALNNSNETIFLYTPSDREVMQVHYTESAKEGESYARTNTNDWQWTTTPTPAATNQFTGVAIETDTNDDTDSGTQEEQVEEHNTNEDTTVSDVVNTTTQEVAIGTIVISEVYPDPDGDDRLYEFIELHNTSSTPVTITNWKLADPSTDYVFSHTFEAHEYVVFERSETDIALNNTGDTITLFSADDSVYDELVYQKAPTGKSYQYVFDTWEWVDPTPREGAVESASGIGGLEADVVSTTNTTDESSESLVPALIELVSYDDNVLVEATGVVTAIPGDFDTRTVYIADQTAGMQIYLHAANWPKMRAGDIVSVIGELRTAYGERRIVLADSHDFEVITHGAPLVPAQASCPDFSTAGALVALQGTKTGTDGSYLVFTIEECGDVFVKKSNLLSEASDDAILDMTGIVRIRDARVYLELLTATPYSVEDHYTATTTSTALTTDGTSTYTLGTTFTSGAKTLPWTIAYMSLAAGITIASITLTLYKRRS